MGLLATDLFQRIPRDRHLRVVEPERADLETVLIAMHVEWNLEQRRRLAGLERGADVGVGPQVRAYEAAAPKAVRLGQALFASGELERLREQGATVSYVVNRLAAGAV